MPPHLRAHRFQVIPIHLGVKMKKFYKIGPVTLLLQDFPTNNIYPFALWKADAYTTAETEPDITISYTPELIVPNGECVKTERSLFVVRRTFVMPDGGMLWQQEDTENGNVILQFIVDAEGKDVRLTVDKSESYGMAAFESLTFIIFYLLLRRGVLTFHGVLMEYSSKGIIISAPSEEGKTTHARLWRDNKNALILNSDRSSCYKENDKWIGFGTPWCGTGGENINRNVPLKALVILKRGKENRACVMENHKILAEVLPHVMYPNYNENLTDSALSLLDEFLQQIPVISLECTPCADAVDVLYDCLEGFI